MQEGNVIVLGISGKFGVGKDEARNHIISLFRDPQQVVSLNWADPVKEMAAIACVAPLESMYTTEGKSTAWPSLGGKVTAGRLQQILGHGLRGQVDPNLWVNIGAQRIVEMRKRNPQVKLFILSDCRYPTEIDYIHSQPGGLSLRINRRHPDPKSAAGRNPLDSSETSLDDCIRFTAVIDNDEDLHTFHRRIRNFATEHLVPWLNPELFNFDSSSSLTE